MVNEGSFPGGLGKIFEGGFEVPVKDVAYHFEFPDQGQRAFLFIFLQLMKIILEDEEPQFILGKFFR